MTLLPTRTVAKPWGREDLPAPFSNPTGEKIGEIWFEPPPELPQLLVKYIFTSEKLSVQVHPSDTQTLATGLGKQGKEECWLVVDAGPQATLGVGFADHIDAAAMRAAALDGSIEDLLVWHKVRAGDFFYIPANTVHAIGPDVAIIEVQQNSDITYRLFDYGRPRELHLEEGMAVARGEPHPAALRRHVAACSTASLVDGPHFRLHRVTGQPAADVAARYPGRLLVIPLTGTVSVAGEEVAAGGCALAGTIGEVVIADGAEALLAAPLG
ncbi:class I mannose-6-phosphate isomerase [Alteraurantiacibacter buctensis]|uniref:Mannose-6-phosphate isomerase n=1 Tax=Alteraurantiacibacter buctensis TaxID=1503981 RepID=A0A844YYW0_9SPHN|nr:class I mannose-6-phosphate isomerase [Alteraurantiacibacter buctensis]MXO73515.1 mannose-6-phosphate isomerase [Alteraurantiacibacter buctensis]